MAKVELKTQKNDGDVDKFLDSVDNEQRKKDANAVMKMMAEITGEKPTMWGSSIIGFGLYHYKSERSKQEGDWPRIGLSPRKQSLTLYIINGLEDYSVFLNKLGKHKTGTGCLYINKLEDVNLDVLRDMIKKAYSTKMTNEV